MCKAQDRGVRPLLAALCPYGASATIMVPLRGTIMVPLCPYAPTGHLGHQGQSPLCFFFRTRSRAFFFQRPSYGTPLPLCPYGAFRASGTIMAPLRGTIMRFAHAWLCFFFRTRKRAQKKSHLLVPRRGPLCLAQEKWLRPLLPSCRIRAACAFIILCANKRL